jgi:hypothetical protein
LQQHEVSEEDLELWCSKADEGNAGHSYSRLLFTHEPFSELSASKGKTWIRYDFAWGRKRPETLEAPESVDPEPEGPLDASAVTSTEGAQGTQGSSHQSPTTPPASQSPLYPYFVVYESQIGTLDAGTTESEGNPQ